ncbi:MAG: helix-turn-helix domain-containing protein [Anaerolineae bacterium]|nr:helix-turn-helix domain-containing protein [Anaerolineae bacterium]
MDAQTDSSHRVSLEDCRKLALPLETRVLAGEGLLSRPVAWVSVLYPQDDPLHKQVQPSELILVSPQESSTMRRTTDVELVRWAAEAKLAALAFFEAVSPSALAEAKAYSVPVLLLPSSSRPRLVERSTVSLLVDQKGQLERRGQQIYRQLTEIIARNEGLNELIEVIARLTNKAVVLQDKNLRVMVSKPHPQLVGAWDSVESFLRDPRNLPVELQDRTKVADIDQPSILQALSLPGLARLVAPVVTNDMGRGYLTIVGLETDLDEIDALMAEHGAAACGLEMAKVKAVSEAEKRLRGSFLERLLVGDVSQQEAVKQGERLDHDMAVPHIAILLSWHPSERQVPSLRRLETLVNGVINNQRIQALVWIRESENEVLVFFAANPEHPIDSGLKLSRTFAEEIHRQYPSNKAALGLGQIAREVSGWRSSYRDARQALDLARRLQTDTPLYIGDLGVYQLILNLSDTEMLKEFCQHTLGSLLDYDQRQNADLIKTLEAFFHCHGNLSQTAEQLIVHRNTLLYRMNRINEIAGIDLDRPETRLALHLALTIRRLLSMG